VPAFTIAGGEILGGVGVQAGCHHTGDRGEWTVVRSRRGKTSEQVDRRHDKLWEYHRQRGSRKQRQGQSRVRVRLVYAHQVRYSEEQLYRSDHDFFDDYYYSQSGRLRGYVEERHVLRPVHGGGRITSFMGMRKRAWWWRTDLVSYNSLRQGFEMCGIMENVY